MYLIYKGYSYDTKNQILLYIISQIKHLKINIFWWTLLKK